MKKALIFGVTGQDGAYLARYLLKRKYEVHGIKRRSSSYNTSRVDGIYEDPYKKNRRLILHYGDLTDTSNIQNLISDILPDEIYNLGAQSHVKVSFETPEYTANCDALGPLRILEAIRNVRKKKNIKFYQASTSEMFGNTPAPQSEKSILSPESPYGTAKVYAYHITKKYRDAYKIFACNGILFNHESPLRGETFVSKKITMAVAKIKLGKQKLMYLGNLDAKRDWGHAKDYVEGMHKILQQKKPDDFVLATGKSFTVRKFVEDAFKCIDVEIIWRGKSLNEVGIDKKTKNVLVKIDKRLFRPNEVNFLKGNNMKAKKILKWTPKINYIKLVKEMVASDLENLSS